MKFILSPAWAALALAGGISAAVPVAATTPVVAPPVPPASPVPAPPAVPSRLAAAGRVQPIGAQVQLSWLPVPRALSYNVYRDGNLLASSPGASWSDYAVASGETHAYTVTSLGAAGESHPCAAATATVPAGGNSVVYADSLVNGWVSWSWAATDLASTSPAHSGKAIRVTAGPWQALYLHHAPFSAAPYAAVTFWINGGSAGGQRLSVRALRSGTPQTAVPLGPLRANQWQSVTIPLSDLGIAGAPDMDGLWVADASGTAQPAFSVDEVALKPGTGTTAPPASSPPVLSLPDAPTGLSATPHWATSCPACSGMAMAHVALAWNAVSGATSYAVYRDGVKVQGGLTTPSLTDMNVVSGHTYAYSVTATGPGGEGAHSASVSATAPNPPGMVLTAPVNLTVMGVWQAAPTDALTWTAVPGAVSYNLYQYDTQIATGLTVTSYTVPTMTFLSGLTYSLTAVGADGAETLPSAVTTAQGLGDPAATPWWTPAPPVSPTALVATPEWNAGAPRIHLSWNGWDTDYTYSVYRDGQKVTAGLWGLNYYDQTVRPGESHTYTVSGVNVPLNAPVESAQSAPTTATAPVAAPAAVPGPVQITGVHPDDDSAVVSFAAVPGAIDYRVYNVATPNTVKYSGGALSVEMNGLDPAAGADLVVEAVDKLGPFQKMDGMAGPGAMAMDGMHEAINGQGDPSDVPNVLAASAPFHVTCKPFVLTGAQAFADTFRNEQPLALQPMPAPTGNPFDCYGMPGCYWEMTNDKWRIRNYVGDVLNTQAFFMGSHFMDTLYDGGTARVSGPLHNNDASLVMMPRATADLSGGGVLHVTFEVDAHFDSRRWCDLIVAPAAAQLLNPGSKAGGDRVLSGTDHAFRWRIANQQNYPEMLSANTDARPHLVETPLLPVNGQSWDVAHSSARLDPYGHTPQANGTAQDLDKRHRFDLYLSRTHFRIMENAVVAWEGDIPADQAMPAGSCQVYFVHQLYHTGNDRPEQVDWEPQNAYWYNHRPWCDERHWDNCGQEVLTGFPSLP